MLKEIMNTNHIWSGVPRLDPIYKNFWISARPEIYALEDYVDSLNEARIRNLVVLMSQKEIKQKYGSFDLIQFYKDEGFHVSRYPIPDFSVPRDINKFSEFVQAIAKATSETLVHCSAGLGRSGLFMSCLMIEFGYSAKDAIKLVRRQRPGAVETPEQEEFVFDYDYMN